MLFLLGYYFMVYTFIYRQVPASNVQLVRDAMLVLGPAVGAIVQSLFRSDARDEQLAVNSGLAWRASAAQAEATKAAAETTPASGGAARAADAVAGAATDKAEEIKGE